MITKCKALWQQAFGDSSETIDAFFQTAYSPENSHQICKDGALIAVLYWLDWHWGENKIAYIYAVATDKAFRKQGYGRALMEQTHGILQDRGYAGAIVVPAEPGLVNMYEKLGYRTFCYGKNREIFPAEPCATEKISWEQYAEIRKAHLPDALQPGDRVYAYLAAFAEFYRTEKSLFCVARQESTLYFQEFLGEKAELPGVIASLGAEKGIVTLADEKTPFAMMYGFADNPMPDYFSLPLD